MNSLVDILKSCGDLFPYCFVISDLEGPDSPLVYANDNFLKLIGRTREEVVGFNCRFLQGEETSKEAINMIRMALRERECCFQDILNYKKDGTPFWNRLMLIPVVSDVLGVRYYVGIQQDISEKFAKSQNSSQGIPSVRQAPSASVLSRVKNPLTDIINSLRSLRYLSDDPSVAMQTRQQIVERLKSDISELCQYVYHLD